MRYISLNVIREQLRNKTIFVIAIIGIVLNILLTANTGGNLTLNGEKLTEFGQLLPVGISIVIFFSSMLAIFLSMNTIPREFERKTTHLVLVRPIKPWQYILALVFGNLGISLLIFGLLGLSLLLFILIHGQGVLFFRLLITILILGFNIALLSSLVSVCSIKISPVFAGLIGFVTYILGVTNQLIDTAAGISENFLFKILAFLSPDIIGVQQQGAAFLEGTTIDLHPLFEIMMFIYVILGIALFLFPKEV